MSLVMLLLLWVAGGTSQNQPTPKPETPTASPYVWAKGCKDCHTEIYTAWEKTKHSTALTRLSAADQQKECAACHVTGGEKVLEDKANAGIQCESCHGAGRAHAESAVAGKPTPLTKKPDGKVCETCHNDKSPHFHGFYYDAMRGLVHKTK
jgi:hypothetical protein